MVTAPYPILIFDGECHFCRRQVLRWRRVTGDRVFYMSRQTIIADQKYLGISELGFENSVQFLESNGRCRHGADAVFRVLAHAGGVWKCFAALYDRCSAFASASEFLYRSVANARSYL
ncbi:MAG: DUF393 domain-containing protein [Candidatus Xiphinematobacter sp.]|nr:MAG: DUF393 domain-containing protein [Candidatus Xiphinematobacter sp.]